MSASTAPNRPLQGIWLVLVWMGASVLMLTATSVARARPLGQTATDGEALFKEKCTACHTIGGGALVGPDLKGVTQRRTKDWLTSWITAPDKVLASNDPTAVQLFQQNNSIPMPNLGLTAGQVASLIAYFDQVDSQNLAVTQPAQPAPAGDPVAGRALFVGNVRFTNGGPPCMGCHSISGLGSLGGGALGPDLTGAYAKYGDVGLADFLNKVPLPTMNAVWTLHPLTLQEQANLFAFLKGAAPSTRPATALWQLAVLAIVGAALLICAAQFLWRGRLRGVRRDLVRKATS